MRIWIVVLQTGRAVAVMALTKAAAYDLVTAKYQACRRPMAASITEQKPQRADDTFGSVYRAACKQAAAHNVDVLAGAH